MMKTIIIFCKKRLKCSNTNEKTLLHFAEEPKYTEEYNIFEYLKINRDTCYPIVEIFEKCMSFF